ncbi:MAG TPA: hypothetical protein VGG88_07870 [Gaiellaceae bacterium]
MAEDLTPADAVLPAAPAPAPTASLATSPHKPRFLFIYGLLGGVFAVAVVLVVLYAGRAITPAAKWSSWHPSGGGLGAEKQIADSVGKAYRLPNGDQLVDVIAQAPSVTPSTGQTIPLHYLAVQGPKGAGNRDYAISPSNSVTYQLCGLGQACNIASGTPSQARGRLVRREALELALYTFKYVGGIDHVIAFMPPASATKQYVVYLQKSDVASELKQPLDDTLAKKVPLPSTIPAREVHIVDGLTEPRTYSFGVAQAPTGDVVLVLKPLPA